MDFNQFKTIYTATDAPSHPGWRREQTGPLVLSTEQAWGQVCEFVRDNWTSEAIFNDANLTIIIEGALYDSSLLSASNLGLSARSRRDQLTKHVPPTAAPALAEPAPVQPKLEGRDSLGDGATSAEKPLGTSVAPETPRHGLQDAADYCFKDRSLKNSLDKLWEECRKESFDNGCLNHAKARSLYDQRKPKIEEEFAPKTNKNESLERIHAEAYDNARRAGCQTYKQVMDRVKAAIDAAKGK